MKASNVTNHIESEIPSNQLHYYYTVVFVPIGIVTNFLTVLVFGRKELNKTNAGFLNRCIAASNVFILTFNLLVIESLYLFNFSILSYSDLSCKVFRLVKKATREVSPIIETILITSRYLEVYCPKQFSFMHKKKFLAWMILVVYVLLFIINIENLFYYRQDLTFNKANTTVIITRCTSWPAAMITSELISALFRSILPSATMLTLNLLIIHRLFQSRALTRTQRSRSKTKRSLKFSCSIILRNLMFIVLNLPYTIMSMIKVAHLVQGEIDYLSLKRIDFLLTICYDISTFYYISFFFMNVTFNKLFLRETVRFFLKFKETSQGGSYTNSKYFYSSPTRPN